MDVVYWFVFKDAGTARGACMPSRPAPTDFTAEAPGRRLERRDGRKGRLIWTTSRGLVARKSANIKPSIALPPIEARRGSGLARRRAPFPTERAAAVAAMPCRLILTRWGREETRRRWRTDGRTDEESDAWMRLRACRLQWRQSTTDWRRR